MPIIDIHPHIVSEDTVKYPIIPADGPPSRWVSEHPATWDQLSEQFHRAGVEKAAVVQASPAYGNDNTYLAEVVEANADQIVGVGSIGLFDDDVISQLDHWVGERGLSGVRLYVPFSAPRGSFKLADESANSVWKWLTEHDISVVMMVGGDTIDQLERVIGRFPSLKVALDHAGRVRFEGEAPSLKDHPILKFVDSPNVFLKLTTVTLESAGGDSAKARDGVKQIVSQFGSERLAWGSSWPAGEGDYSDYVQLLRDSIADLPQADADNICSGTALRLYPKLA